MRVAENVAEEIDPAGPDREYLVIAFNLELQPAAQILPYLGQQGVERRLVWCQDHQVVGVAEVIADQFDLFEPMIESR